MTLPSITVCILAGEASGDKHAAALVKEIKYHYPQASFFGIGGDALKAEGVHLYAHVSEIAMMGLNGITKVLPKVLKVKKILKRKFKESPPNICIPVDYGGFNLKICKLAKNFNIPVAYYIPPKMWAWNKKRVKTLQKYTDKVFVINKFELDFYLDHGVNAEYVGNPTWEEIEEFKFSPYFRHNHKIDEYDPLVGVFPGSRKKEIENILPVFLKSIKILHDKNPKIQFAISQAPNLKDEVLNPYLKDFPVPIKIIKNDSLNLMDTSDFLILKSGTTTLEAGLMGVPMLVTYITDALTYEIGKRILNIKYISLVNLSLNKEAVKEYIQDDAKPELIAQETLAGLNGNRREEILNSLSDLQKLTENMFPSEIVFDAIQPYIEKTRKRSQVMKIIKK